MFDLPETNISCTEIVDGFSIALFDVEVFSVGVFVAARVLMAMRVERQIIRDRFISEFLFYFTLNDTHANGRIQERSTHCKGVFRLFRGLSKIRPRGD